MAMTFLQIELPGEASSAAMPAATAAEILAPLDSPDVSRLKSSDNRGASSRALFTSSSVA